MLRLYSVSFAHLLVTVWVLSSVRPLAEAASYGDLGALLVLTVGVGGVLLGIRTTLAASLLLLGTVLGAVPGLARGGRVVSLLAVRFAPRLLRSRLLRSLAVSGALSASVLAGPALAAEEPVPGTRAVTAVESGPGIEASSTSTSGPGAAASPGASAAWPITAASPAWPIAPPDEDPSPTTETDRESAEEKKVEDPLSGHTRDASGADTAPAEDSGSSDTDPPREEAAPDDEESSTVLVDSGDTLWDIATELDPGAETPATARLVELLHETNVEVIGPDPHLIMPGQRLEIP